MFANPSRRSDRQGAQASQARRRKSRPSLEPLEGRQLMSLGAGFPISPPGPYREFDPDVAIDDFGDFVVSYTRVDPRVSGDSDVFVQLVDGFNHLVSVQQVAVSPTGAVENHSSVAMSPDGHF